MCVRSTNLSHNEPTRNGVIGRLVVLLEVAFTCSTFVNSSMRYISPLINLAMQITWLSRSLELSYIDARGEWVRCIYRADINIIYRLLAISFFQLPHFSSVLSILIFDRHNGLAKLFVTWHARRFCVRLIDGCLCLIHNIRLGMHITLKELTQLIISFKEGPDRSTSLIERKRVAYSSPIRVYILACIN